MNGFVIQHQIGRFVKSVVDRAYCDDIKEAEVFPTQEDAQFAIDQNFMCPQFLKIYALK